MDCCDYDFDYRFRLLQGNNVAGNAPVRVSFVTLPDEDSSGYRDRICFNVGRELYVYPYGGVSKVRCSSFLFILHS